VAYARKPPSSQRKNVLNPNRGNQSRSDTPSEILEKLEQAFRKLNLGDADARGIPYKSVIPGIAYELLNLRPVDKEKLPSPKIAGHLIALKEHAEALEGVPLPSSRWRNIRDLIRRTDIPAFPKRKPQASRKGAPAKNQPQKIAQITAMHFYGLTGKRPTRSTPVDYGKARGPFIELLTEIYEILGISASAANQAKAAIAFMAENENEID
jgi:hypothetical protein